MKTDLKIAEKEKNGKMQPIMNVTVSNPEHPEYGEATIPCPIPSGEYGHCLELLTALGIGSAIGQDCKVDEVRSAYDSLKCIEGKRANLDELDLLHYDAVQADH